MEAIVEILDQTGTCRERYKILTLPAKVGRAYSCDVVLSDSYTCPEHFEITKAENGKLRVTDLGSINGTFLQNKKRKVTSQEVEVSVDFRIGQTLLRVIDPSVPLAQTLPFDRPGFWSRRIRFSWRHAFFSFLFFITAYFIDSYLLNYRTGENQNFEVLIAAIVGSSMVFLPWAAIWALLGKVNINKPRFFAHFSIPLIVSFFYGLFKRGYGYIEFAFAQPAVLSWFAWVFAFLAIASLFYYHLLYATKIIERRRLIYSCLASILLIAISILVDLKNEFSFSNELPLSYLVKPPWVRVVPALEIDDFVDKLSDLKDEL